MDTIDEVWIAGLLDVVFVISRLRVGRCFTEALVGITDIRSEGTKDARDKGCCTAFLNRSNAEFLVVAVPSLESEISAACIDQVVRCLLYTSRCV